MIRTCADSGKTYDLPIPYEKANPDIRDKCIDCIEKYQQEHEKKGEWYI